MLVHLLFEHSYWYPAIRGKLTVSEPFAKVEFLRSTGNIDKALLHILAEVVKNNVNMGLQSLDIARGVVLGHWTLHLGMFSRARRAEDMVCDLPIDDGAVVVIELGLIIVSSLVDGFATKGLSKTYLEPFAISAVDGLDQLGVIEVEGVRADTDNGPVLLV